jgi:hypothetical protein
VSVRSAEAGCQEATQRDATTAIVHRVGLNGGPVVTRPSCPACHLRFAPAAAAHLTVCPVCGGSLQTLDRPESAIGFRLYVPEQALPLLPDAVAVSVPVPDPSPRRL